MNPTRWLVLPLLLALVVALLISPALCEWTGRASADPPFSYALTNDAGLRFLDEYNRLGGADTLGYPASNRFTLPDGFTYQLTQAALLQWRPDLDAVSLANSFEMLEAAGKDDWLHDVKGIPRPISDDGSAGDWEKAKETRLGWLEDEAIKAKYLANPNPGAIASWSEEDSIQLYGLPMSQPEQFGPFVCQRFQRVSLQLWVEEVEGMPAPGTVVRVLGGDLLKEAGLVPGEALEVGDRPTATPTATATQVTATPTKKPSRPRSATATPMVTPTATSTSVPTPDPSHPPEQGTFTGYFSEKDGPTIRIGMDTTSPTLSREGPFHNFAFTQDWVGKTLVVTELKVQCPPPEDEGCERPGLLLLYRSNIGELHGGMGVHVPQLDGVLRHPPYGGILVTPTLHSWKIEYGQYFIFWFTVTPGTWPGRYPKSVTYSVEIR